MEEPKDAFNNVLNIGDIVANCELREGGYNHRLYISKAKVIGRGPKSVRLQELDQDNKNPKQFIKRATDKLIKIS